MNDINILDAIEFIDADIIVEADSYEGKKKNSHWIVWVAIAAGLLIGVAGVITKLQLRTYDCMTGNPIQTADGTNLTSEYIAGAADTVNAGSEEAVEESEADVVNDRADLIDEGNADLECVKVTDAEGYIPPIELPSNTDGAVYDMTGLVVYQGGIYTQAYNYRGSEAEKIRGLLGAYLGYATGSIDEWASQDDLAVEFASSIEGEVYEVLGYDTSFRICVCWESEDENGVRELQLEFLDRLNGITLTTGADLFETRLYLRDRISKIQWQSHYDWDYAGGNIQNASIDSELWESFLSQLDAGVFVNTWDDNMYTDPTSTNRSIYDTDKQAHVILTMNDGTVIKLRLIEGGYVGYDALGWYFVHIPGETFDAVFDALGGNK